MSVEALNAEGLENISVEERQASGAAAEDQIQAQRGQKLPPAHRQH